MNYGFEGLYDSTCPREIAIHILESEAAKGWKVPGRLTSVALLIVVDPSGRQCMSIGNCHFSDGERK